MENHKEIVTRFYEGLWNNADKSAIPDLLHEEVTFRGSLGMVKQGHKGFALYMDFIGHALGDYQCKVIDIAADDEKVWARVHYAGEHRGELFGYAATHAKLKWEGVAIFTFSEGKIFDIWVLGDINGVMKQLSRYVMD
ncbi:MAG TPA: ester cyclase [Methylophilaceae bacterium]|jgi:predicted ester cyclase